LSLGRERRSRANSCGGRRKQWKKGRLCVRGPPTTIQNMLSNTNGMSRVRHVISHARSHSPVLREDQRKGQGLGRGRSKGACVRSGRASSRRTWFHGERKMTIRKNSNVRDFVTKHVTIVAAVNLGRIGKQGKSWKTMWRMNQKETHERDGTARKRTDHLLRTKSVRVEVQH